MICVLSSTNNADMLQLEVLYEIRSWSAVVMSNDRNDLESE